MIYVHACGSLASNLAGEGSAALGALEAFLMESPDGKLENGCVWEEDQAASLAVYAV